MAKRKLSPAENAVRKLTEGKMPVAIFMRQMDRFGKNWSGGEIAGNR